MRANEMLATLVAIWFFPNLLYFLRITNSLQTGLELIACAILITHLKRSTSGNTHGLKKAIRLAATLMLFLLTHGLIASLYNDTDYLRQTAFIIITGLIALSAYIFSNSLTKCDSSDFDKTLRKVGWSALLIAFLGMTAKLEPPGFGWEKPMFPFSEPSHFAFTMAPVFLYFCIRSSIPARIALMMLGLGVGLAVQNLTTLTIVILSALLALPTRHILIIIMGAILIGPAMTHLDTEYFTSRIDLSDENTNTSTLVFLQGWEMLYTALTKTHWIGLGYQQLGTNGPFVDTSELIYSHVGDYLNLKDGGFLFSKITSEMGAFGLTATAMYLYIFAVLFARTRRAATTYFTEPAWKTFAACSVIAFSIEFFIRGAGYFTPSAFITYCSFIALFKSSAANRKPPEHLAIENLPTFIRYRAVE